MSTFLLAQAAQPSSSKWYLNPAFWSVIVAAIAVVLSQLPPLKTLLRRARVQLDAYSRISVSHMLGTPVVRMHVLLTNVGARSIRIGTIRLVIQREDGNEIALPGQMYVRLDGAKVLLTPFHLAQGAEWTAIVEFFAHLDPQAEKTVKALTKQLRDNLVAKIRGLNEQQKASGQLVEADEDLVSPVRDVFSRNNIWLAGEYTARLEAECLPTRACVSRRFRFTLYESDSTELAEFADRYKYGEGVYFDGPEKEGIGIPTRGLES